MGTEQQLLQTAVLEIRPEQTLERQQRGEQRAHPHDARTDAAEQGRVSAQGKWKQTHNRRKEHHRIAQLAEPSHRQQEIPPQDCPPGHGQRGAHATASVSVCCRTPAGSVRVWCVLITATPLPMR